MATIGFNFTKMLVEHLSNASGKISVSNNISIVNAEQYQLAMTPGANNAISITFKFELRYTPEIGTILLEGQVLELISEQELKENLAVWKEKKILKREMLSHIMQVILARCQIQAIILAKELNLPSPIPLPKLSIEDNKSEATTSAQATPAPASQPTHPTKGKK